MTDDDLDRAEWRARDFLARTEELASTNQNPSRMKLFHAARVVCDDTLRAVDMVRAERSARRSIQEQRDHAVDVLARQAYEAMAP